jgi:hypothetical protein
MSDPYIICFRYENSSLPEDRIGKLVTETLAAVGLKVCQVSPFFV